MVIGKDLKGSRGQFEGTIVEEAQENHETPQARELVIWSNLNHVPSRIQYRM
jgi:hypothetical protein